MDSVPALVLQRQIARAVVLIGAKKVVRILRAMADALDGFGDVAVNTTTSPVSPCSKRCQRPEVCHG